MAWCRNSDCENVRLYVACKCLHFFCVKRCEYLTSVVRSPPYKFMQIISISHLIYFWINQDPALSNYATSVLQNIASLNPLNPELNPICYFLALLRAHHFLHVSRIRVKLLTFRRLMSYICGAPILDVSRSHTTTQHSR